jgi:hypothetical protein
MEAAGSQGISKARGISQPRGRALRAPGLPAAFGILRAPEMPRIPGDLNNLNGLRNPHNAYKRLAQMGGSGAPGAPQAPESPRRARVLWNAQKAIGGLSGRARPKPRKPCKFRKTGANCKRRGKPRPIQTPASPTQHRNPVTAISPRRRLCVASILHVEQRPLFIHIRC